MGTALASRSSSPFRPNTEETLSLSRAKPKSLFISLAYRSKRVCQYLLGRNRMLRVFLNLSWLFHRFAFELSGEVFGNTFHNCALGLSEEQLYQWVPKGSTVIDIGCGSGRWCRVAARSAAHVLGIDYSNENINIARSLSENGHIEYVVGDITKHVSGRSFDVALLIHVLEHVDDVDSLLTAIGRIASVLVVEVPDFEADALNLVRRELGCRFYSDGDHVREYTVALLHQQLLRNGWRVEEHFQRGGTILARAVRPSSSPGDCV
jgi:SAM-dependent methyltransferase